jgi:glycosyltransferase involved in cell wall biosynthesis
MNILVISEHYPPYVRGGAEISTSLLVNFISKVHNCYVITQKHQKESWGYGRVKVYPILNDTNPDLKNLKQIFHYLFTDPLIYPAINVIKLVKFIKQKNIDLISLIATSYLTIPLIICAIITKRPIVIDLRTGALICPTDFSRPSCENIDIKKHNCFLSLRTATGVWPKKLESFRIIFAIYKSLLFWIYFKLFKLVIHYKRLKFVALSKSVKKQYILAGVPSKKISVIYNMINEKNIIRRKYYAKNQIIYSGRIEREKGIYDAIKAFEILNDKSLEFLIAGTGSEFENIKKYLKENNLFNIKLLGYLNQEELMSYIKHSKIIIAPSTWSEGFGRFILDSIAFRIPVISTKVGGIKEGIKNRKTGLLVKPNNPVELSQAIKVLLTNKTLYQEIKNNLKLEESKYSSRTIGNMRLKLFLSMVGHT